MTKGDLLDAFIPRVRRSGRTLIARGSNPVPPATPNPQSDAYTPTHIIFLALEAVASVVGAGTITPFEPTPGPCFH